MQRRDFIGHTARLAGASTLATTLGGLASGCDDDHRDATEDLVRSQRSVLDGSPDDSGIDAVVLLTMENRSFDHYLGWLATDERYLANGRKRYGRRFSIDGRQQLEYRAPDGQTYPTQHLPTSPIETNPWRGCAHVVPGHGWLAGRAQRDRGFLGQGTGNDQFAIGYYRAEDLALHQQLAERFTVFDDYHSSLLAGTFPNRQYLHAATSDGRKEDPVPLKVGVYHGPTIWDRLEAASVSARYYYTDLPILTLWGKRYYDRISVLDDFFDDARRGRLPKFSMVDPGFKGPWRTDAHPQGDVRTGQRFMREIVRAVVDSPQWERTLFVITYDEWGGFFDHVRPPILPDSRASLIDVDNFGQAGFRVPTLLISPQARPGFVDHRLYDHTSILRFVEWRFLGAPPEGPKPGSGRPWWLSTRDRRARNLGASLVADSKDPELGFDIDVELGAPTLPCLGPPPKAPDGALGAAAPTGDESLLDGAGSGEIPMDDELAELTQQRFPDTQARPWIEGLDLPGSSS